MKAVWPTTASDSAASEAATITTPPSEAIRPNEMAWASGMASTR